MKHLYTTLLLFFFTLFVYAQKNILNNFKNRHQEIKGLNFEIDLNGNGVNQYTLDSDNRTGSGSSNLNLGVEFLSYLNTDYLQKSTFIGGRVNNSFSSTNNDNGDETYKNHIRENDDYFYYSKSSNFYRPNQKFKHFSYRGSVGFGFSNSKSSSNDKNLSSNENSSLRNYLRPMLNIRVGEGKGRLENVGAAVNAIFMLKKLEEVTGIVASRKMIKEVALGIASIRNQRYLDGRISLMRQLAMLDSVLKANGAIKETNVKAFAIMNDNWVNNYLQFNRTAGKRKLFYLDISSGVGFNNSKNSNRIVRGTTENLNFFRSSNLNNNIHPRIGYQYSFHIQKSTIMEFYNTFDVIIGINMSTLKLGSSFSKTSMPSSLDSYEERTNDYFSSNLNYSGGVIVMPNNRNYFKAEVSADIFLDQSVDILRKKSSKTDFEFEPIISLDLNYYKFINQNLYLSVFFKNQANLTHSNYRFGAKVNYLLF